MRKKKKIIGNVSRPEAEDAFANYNDKYSKLQVISGEMNSKITAIKEKYESRIGVLQDEMDTAFEVLQGYANEHPELFEKRKSVEWTHGSFGFRTGTPKLKTLKGFTWASVLSIAKSLFPSYIRTVDELNKEQLIAERETLGGDLKKLGVEVVQDEVFFVSPKLEELANA